MILLGALSLLVTVSTIPVSGIAPADVVTMTLGLGWISLGLLMGATSRTLRLEVSDDSLDVRGAVALRRTLPLSDIAVVRQVDLWAMRRFWLLRLSVVKLSFVPNGDGVCIELKHLRPHPIFAFLGYRAIVCKLDRQPTFLATLQARGIPIE